jgi:ribosome maturation factor RimP
MTQLESIAADVCARENVQLYDLEFTGSGSQRALQVFIQKAEGQIGIEDCSNVSKALNVVLDADEALIPGGPYTLEVSSPGLERALRTPGHFQGAVGKTVWVKLAGPLSDTQPNFPNKALLNSKQITAPLVKADAHGIEMDVAGTPVTFVWADLEKGKTVFMFEAEGEKSLKANPKNKNKDHKKKKVGQ